MEIEIEGEKRAVSTGPVTGSWQVRGKSKGSIRCQYQEWRERKREREREREGEGATAYLKSVA